MRSELRLQSEGRATIADRIGAIRGAPAWMAEAACAQADPEAWWPGKGESDAVRYAKRVCGRCDVTAQCLEWAISTGETVGIYGGLTPKERRRVVRERRAA